MKTQKYSVNQYLIENILSWIQTDEIAIPEIQRPFVWDSTQVRDLMDSLYHGYPIGYLIAWRNPNVRLKDGKIAEGRKILIDGQQRVIALKAAILGYQIINKDYKRVKIQISFHPSEEKFEVFNTAIAKDPAWLPDISPIITDQIRTSEIIKDYCQKNENANEHKLEDTIYNLKKIIQKQIGMIDLDSDLDIETVTEVFIRINSKGVVLSQADFAMSKIAANEIYGGSVLRKCIDYFSHMAVNPEFYHQIHEIDKEFTRTEYFPKISWLKNESDDLYDPSYSDLLRVAFTTEFSRGRISDLVSLLSGRNFETRTYEEEIAEQSFERLKQGIMKFIKELNFKKFVMIIKSAGFISPKLIRSQNTINFAYIIYLKLKSEKYRPHDIESYVRRWFVLSILTGRYSGAADSQFDFDIKNISKRNFKDYINDIEQAELSDAFWNAALVQSLNTSVASSPYFNVYLAAQIASNNKGFLSRDINVRDLVLLEGDIHHVFPRAYLKKHELSRGQYNQIANYVYMQSEINIQIGAKSPNIYFKELLDQCETGGLKYGGIRDLKDLKKNLKMNCVPLSVFDMDVNDYENFLNQRRALIAKKIKDYYFSL